MKDIADLFIGIINQSKAIHYKHNCGDSENLIYMATELRTKFLEYIQDEKSKLNVALALLETIL